MLSLDNNSNDATADRRKFLAACGKFAAVTPPRHYSSFVDIA